MKIINNQIITFIFGMLISLFSCQSTVDYIEESPSITPLTYNRLPSHGFISQTSNEGFPLLARYSIQDSNVFLNRLFVFNKDSTLRDFYFYDRHNGEQIFVLKFDSLGRVTGYEGHVLTMNYTRITQDSINLIFEMPWMKSFETHLVLDRISKDGSKNRLFEYYPASTESFCGIDETPLDSCFILYPTLRRKSGFTLSDTLIFKTTDLQGGTVRLYFGGKKNHYLNVSSLQ